MGGDAFDGVVGGFEEALGKGDALLKEPLIGADAEGGVKAAGEGARTHEGAGGHLFDGEFFVEVGGYPGKGAAKGFLFFGGSQGRFDVLRLIACALGGDDHAPGDGCGDGGSVVLADDVKGEVDGGGGSGGGEYLAVVDVEDAGVDLDVGIAGGEFGGPAPMRGDAAAIEQPGFGEDEGSGAEGEDARATPIGEAEGFEQGMGYGDDARTRAGDDDGVGLDEIGEGVGCGDEEAAKGVDGARRGGAEEKAIPGDVEFGAFDAEDFGGYAEFEGVDGVVDDGGDGASVCFLLLHVFSASGRGSPFMAGL